MNKLKKLSEDSVIKARESISALDDVKASLKLAIEAYESVSDNSKMQHDLATKLISQAVVNVLNKIDHAHDIVYAATAEPFKLTREIQIMGEQHE